MIRYEFSCGHKIDGAKTKTRQTKKTEGGERESTLQRTSSFGRDSDEKNKQTGNKSKINKGQPHIYIIYRYIPVVRVGQGKHPPQQATQAAQDIVTQTGRQGQGLSGYH